MSSSAHVYSGSHALPPMQPGGGMNYIYVPSGLRRVENLAKYNVGGLHPVDLSHSYQEGRYKIVHKLGNGGFSTTWLARDSQTDTYVALKFVTADASQGYGDLKILRGIRGESNTSSGYKYINHLLDEFYVDGPNGHHLCLVSKVLGPSISNVSDDLHRLSGKASQELASQAVSALVYLHSLGICHGDFTSANTLLQFLETLDTFTVDELYTVIGEPVKETLRTLDGSVVGPSAPSYVVDSVDFMAVPNLLSLRLKVIDFDQAFPVSSPPSTPLGTPARCLSPEAIFDHEVGVASDVWALGCLIFKIRSGFELFASFDSSGPDYAVMQIVKTLGPLPEKWRSRKFDDDGYPVQDCDERIHDAEELEYEPFRAPLLEAVREIEGDPNVLLAKNHNSLEAELWTPSYESKDIDGSNSTMRISREEADLLFDLLLKIFKYSPEERLGLREIADHPWFKIHI